MSVIMDAVKRLRRHEVLVFRIALGTIFIWFGFLKLIGQSAVIDIIRKSYSILAQTPYIYILGIFEVVIGVGMYIGKEKYVRYLAVLMVLHLSGTLLIFFTSPSLVFKPAFPILTLEGEFIIKNLALIAGGLAILSNIGKGKK